MKKALIIMWPIGGILLILMVAAFFLFKVPHLLMVPSKKSTFVPGESLKIADINYSQDYKDGEGKWELKAKEAHFFDKEQVVALKHVLLKLQSLKKTSYTIVGNEGDYFRKSGRIILKGDVQGKSENGYQIETDLLIFEQRYESVETDSPIRVIGPFFRVKGDGLYIDLRKKKFMVKSNVCTTFMDEGLL